MSASDRLSALDAAFLHLDRPGLPIHIATVGLFQGRPLLHPDGSFRLDEVRRHVEARIGALPRFRRRAMWPHLGLSRPRWVDDPRFDIADHVDVVELASSAGSDGLLHHAEELVAEGLPLDRPLWHLRFVTGLPEGRVGLVERVHHALVDGISDVEVAAVLLDLEPGIGDLPHRSAAPAPTTGALDDLLEPLASPIRAARSAFGALTHPVDAGRRAAALARATSRLAGDGLVAPRSSLNHPVGPTRRLSWVTVDLASVKACAHARGGTANDVVLAAVAHGLRALLLGRGEVLMPDAVVKVAVPVSLRPDRAARDLGNQVGAMLVRLPVGIGDPAARLDAIVRIDTELKAGHEADLSRVLLSGADLLPAPLLGPLVRLSHHQPLANVIVTNVPGPPVPLYFRGARMLEAYPVVPLGGNLTVGVAALSYDGTLSIGLTADGELVPDLEVLHDGIAAGFQVLPPH